ncbi:MAG: GSU2403 family nucleotidyltransferase fold protein [Pseudomonadota bacterium]
MSQHANASENSRDLSRDCARLMRILRAEGYLTPDLATGQVLQALARVGVFRLGGTLVGTQAFRSYEGVLGVQIGFDQSAMTQDIDIASFERLSLVLNDAVDPALPGVFDDLKFAPVPSMEKGRVWRWMQTKRQTLVEFLTPSFSEDEGLRPLKALGVSAQSLHHLNYLIAEPLTVPLLYRSGVLIQVPRPERYGIHKLIVADRRLEGPQSQKSQKDRAQAAFLVAVLSEERPDDLRDAYMDARARGKAWQQRIDRSLARMPKTAARLSALV